MTETNQIFYTGIGSRATPASDVGIVMTLIAEALEQAGWILRSGGAGGADTFFENGVVSDTMKEIYLPWKKFNKNQSPLFKFPSEIKEEAIAIARTVIPWWDELDHASKALHGRNVHQVLGKDLRTPSSLLVCWTHEAHEKGGTATAIKLARNNGIPILNFGKFEDQSIPSLLHKFLIFYEFSGDFPPISLTFS